MCESINKPGFDRLKEKCAASYISNFALASKVKEDILIYCSYSGFNTL